MERSQKVMISQSNYIPWKGYFDSIHLVDDFILYDDMQFTRRDWRNRNVIKTPSGLHWLTIPVDVKGKYLQRIQDTKVADPSWGAKHWKTIRMNYSRAPHFEEIASLLEPIYSNPGSEYLSEINHRFLVTICKYLGIETRIRWSREFDLTEGKTQRLVDLATRLGASEYYTGPSAKDYLEEEAFTRANIRVKYLDYSGYPEYPQLHGQFEHAVSIIDLLFSAGPSSTLYMKNFVRPSRTQGIA